jgi:UDP-glucose 6-dehydrogenase
MLKNNTINKSHTIVPGKKGMLSYHGSCLPKDINTMSAYLTRCELPNNVIKSAVEGRQHFLNRIINKPHGQDVSQI